MVGVPVPEVEGVCEGVPLGREVPETEGEGVREGVMLAVSVGGADSVDEGEFEREVVEVVEGELDGEGVDVPVSVLVLEGVVVSILELLEVDVAVLDGDNAVL